ncbi:hypothetical protein [Vibrio parahaemolyticus]|uniref:hypothetical protein n=1 Tax=Vibrio parahaemolyticus TaxID=670 RepID=UPI00193D20F2|nr:hypothetical protein [Vibrio parahaemolyticus]EGQ9760180.1 hypothetical protein [Vibrio parahaemolyticus]MBM5063302.1 hypothetical protein [Vibrio parahaemolyticus]
MSLANLLQISVLGDEVRVAKLGRSLRSSSTSFIQDTHHEVEGIALRSPQVTNGVEDLIAIVSSYESQHDSVAISAAEGFDYDLDLEEWEKELELSITSATTFFVDSD